MRFTSFAVVPLLLAAGLQQAASGGVVSWIGHGHSYEIVGDIHNYPNDVWTWQASEVLAESRSFMGMPGHLATITSAEENQFVLDNFFPTGAGPVTWIGLTCDPEYGGTPSSLLPWPQRQTQGWIWVTGETVSYTNWWPYAEAPSDYIGCNFAAIGSQWEDHAYWANVQSGTGGHARFLVEYDVAPVPEPSTLVGLMGTGVMGLAVYGWRRRRLPV